MFEAIYLFSTKMGLMFIPLFGVGFFGWCHAFKIFWTVYNESKIKSISNQHFQENLETGRISKKKYYLEKSLLNIFALTIIHNKKKGLEYTTMRLNYLLNRYIMPLRESLKLIILSASVAPLMGLLGTVNGMITTFEVISSFGNSSPLLLSDGISEALLTTQSGLVIAFPLLFIHVLLKNQVNKIEIVIKQYYTQLNKIYQ